MKGETDPHIFIFRVEGFKLENTGAVDPRGTVA